jgi:hypothetical protein
MAHIGMLNTTAMMAMTINLPRTNRRKTDDVLS